MDKTLILNKIKTYLKIEKNTDFAEFLEIKPTTLAMWYKRNTFDIELLFKKCEFIDANWLLTGEGEMLKNAPAPEPAPQESHAGADRYTALLEDKIALLEKNNASLEYTISIQEKITTSQEREIQRQQEKITSLENTIKELKSKLQKTVAKQENDIINLQGEDLSAMKSPNLPPDDPLQPSRRV